jgi:predicted DNA-binding transcriptional regulator AlpA
MRISENKQFYRPVDVIQIYGISRTTIFRWINEGKLPQPKRVTSRVVGWDKATLDAIFLK